MTMEHFDHFRGFFKCIIAQLFSHANFYEGEFTKKSYHLTLFILDTGKNSEDPDEIPHKGLHCLLRSEIHHFIQIFLGNQLKYKIDNSMLIVSICMGKSD